MKFNLFIVMIGWIIQNGFADTSFEVDDDTQNNYAVNAVIEEKDLQIDESSTTINESIIDASISNIDLINTEKLSESQSYRQTSLLNLVKNYADDELSKIEILDESTDGIVFANIQYKDSGLYDSVVVTYDKYTTRNFMRCVSRDYWEYLENGLNDGDGTTNTE